MTWMDVLRRAPRPPSPGPAAPSPPGEKATDEESLGRELLALDAGLGIFRWVHLADALRRTPGARSVVSFGSGGGLHEAYLARTRPDLNVTAVDLQPPWVRPDLSNLRFLVGDLLDPSFRGAIPAADFVYSIECLEHIEDDATVVRAMAERVAPGGTLYLQVPFANSAEQRDAELCRVERANHGHVRPGYDERGLVRLVEANGLRVDLVACAFWSPLQPMVWAATEKFGAALGPRWREVVELVSADLKDRIAPDRSHATAIKVLARRDTMTR